MNYLIGLGSNLGDRALNIETALNRLAQVAEVLQVSPIYVTPALLPAGGPRDWQLPYLNAVCEMKWTSSARELLRCLKKIEVELGRLNGPRWAPRILDLDILSAVRDDGQLDDSVVDEPDLTIPHRDMWKRSFVLDPLKDIKPYLFIKARSLKTHAPAWVGILNVTPDSFSDGGQLASPSQLRQTIENYAANGVQILDFGAESTRPHAVPLTADEEWLRLEPALQVVDDVFRGRNLQPILSLDSRHVENVRRAIAFGIRWINDVSGLADLKFLDVIRELTREKNGDYVLMHSLSVPADPALTLDSDQDIVETIKSWAMDKLEILKAAGISPSRVIFDPGIGFGKTAWQSIELLKRIEEFKTLPVRLLVGHSRKGFLKTWSKSGVTLPADRDPESVGVSLSLASRGVDYIRVHNPELHLRAYHAFREAESR